MGTEISMIVGTPRGYGVASSHNRAGIAWLERLAARQTASISSHGNEADSCHCESSIPMELDNSGGH